MTYLLIRKKHFKVLKWPKCCFSIREYPLKMEEMSNSESSNYPQAWESSMRIPEHSIAANFATGKKVFSCYYGFSRLLDYIYARARTRFSGDYQLNLESIGKAAVLASVLACSTSAPQVWNPVKVAFQWRHCVLKCLGRKKYFPPQLFPRWLVRKSFCFLPCAEPHLVYFCCVEICNNKTVCYSVSYLHGVYKP